MGKGMNKIKKTFAEWRNNTPKRVQWLLLAVAFVVVLILFTLLLTGNKDKAIKDIDVKELDKLEDAIEDIEKKVDEATDEFKDLDKAIDDVDGTEI